MINRLKKNSHNLMYVYLVFQQRNLCTCPDGFMQMEFT